MEEMLRDSRVIFYGEDVAEYGGAFKLSKGLLKRSAACGFSMPRFPKRPSAGPRWARP